LIRDLGARPFVLPRAAEKLCFPIDTAGTAHHKHCPRESLPSAGRFCPPFFKKRTSVDCSGGVPEGLKGTDCKSVGLAYVGSNPTPSTRTPPHELAGVAQW